MKVLHVTGSLNRGGAETFVVNLFKAIDNKKITFDFVVYGYEKQHYEDEVIALGARVFHIPHNNTFDKLLSTFRIYSILRKNGPYRALHAHTLHNSIFSLISAKFHNVKTITHSHNTKNKTEKSLLIKIYELITRFLIQKLSDVWFACGKEAGIYLFGTRFKKRGHVIMNGINTKHFQESNNLIVHDLKHKLGICNELVVVNIARLEEVKNHAFMLNIARVMKEKGIEFRMLFVGTGPLLQKLTATTEILNLQTEVQFLGVRSDINDILHLSDVFIMPSLFEGNPVSLIEAQTAGLPCVISHDISETIDMGIGLLRRLNLSDNIDDWINTLLTFNRKTDKELPTPPIDLSKSAYDIKQVAIKALRHY